jgi:SAM-dependent methyltransferase
MVDVDDETMPHAPLDQLIAQLPERYQPIYGQGDETTSRSADSPRTAHIMSTIDLVGAHLGRPIRVLDLGSAQGYYCFLTAEHHHHATGVDYLPINIAVSRAVHELHPQLSVDFVEADLEVVSQLVSEGNFDLVLGLSILHHVAHRDGHTAAVELVQQLRDHVPFGLFEMALREEPVHWAASLPGDPRVTLAPYEFIRELTWSPTHLSDIERPLLFCSRSHVLVNGRLFPILRYAETSHPAAAAVLAGKRRYYDTDQGIVKIAARFGEVIDSGLLQDLQDEIRQEADVIEKLTGSTFGVPTIIEFHDAPTEVIIAKTTFPGRLLSEVVTTLDIDDRLTAFEQTLHQLADLETLGWYHTDLRTWNVVWDPSQRRAQLIDHGALAQRPTDAAWPGDAYYSFVVFALALWTGTADQAGLESPRAVSVEIAQLPNRAARLLIKAIQRPCSATFFRNALAEWDESSLDEDSLEVPLAVQWLLDTGAMLNRDHVDRQVEINSLLEAYQKLELAQAETLAGYGELTEQNEHVLVEHRHLTDQYEQALESRSVLEATYNETLNAYHQRDSDYHAVLQSYQRIDDLYRAAHEALAQATAELVCARDEVADASQERERLGEQLQDERQQRVDLEQSISAIRNTVSWRITRPLRAIRRRL